MSGRLHDVEARIGTVRQLEAIVTAMRGIASVRAREARERIQAVRAHADIVGRAIGDALAMQAGDDRGGAPRRVVPMRTALLVVTPDQGFVGGLPDRLLDRAMEVAGSAPVDLLIVGDRGLMLAGVRGLDVAWSVPMLAHVDDVPALADHVAGALYDRLDTGRVRQLAVVHGTPSAGGEGNTVEIIHRQLVPFDFSRFPVSGRRVAPLITLPPAELLDGLAAEYVFAELCEVLLLAYAAENTARMTAMIAAKTGIERRREDLTNLARRIHQDEITDEIIELATGGMAVGRNGAG
ncbi:FoF1 ATP synthase subunit gamma [Tistrella mobilis]|uniref:F0F1 ATP synthase subunit gamma n=1 Tax=Tistrella mobilis TaxID=171437 RepID=UPI0031F6B39A